MTDYLSLGARDVYTAVSQLGAPSINELLAAAVLPVHRTVLREHLDWLTAAGYLQRQDGKRGRYSARWSVARAVPVDPLERQRILHGTGTVPPELLERTTLAGMVQQMTGSQPAA
jgi:hypothetical protein